MVVRFEYGGDSQWYIETSAQWYMANFFLQERETYMQVKLQHSLGLSVAISC